MHSQADLQEIVYRAIDRVNELLLDENTVPKAPETVLAGAGGRLDSMGFINFIVALEEEITNTFQVQIGLVEKLQSQARTGDEQPLTVKSLTDLLQEVVRPK